MRAQNKIRKLVVLVDWHNYRKFIVPDTNKMTPQAIFKKCIDALYNEIILNSKHFSNGEKMVRRIRLYNGWHSGREKVPDRLFFERAIFNNPGLYRKNPTKLIGFPDLPEFADHILIDEKYGCLHDSHRGSERQKMVDTGLVADALSILQMRRAEVALVVSDDDDFIPLLVAAQALRQELYLLRSQGEDISHVTDIACDRLIFRSA